jgi:hypothetical protein
MAGKKKQFNFSTMHLSDIPKFVIAMFKGQLGPEEQVMTEQTGFYEINLVPDIKAEMIKAQKTRNLMFFVCIVISIVSVSTALILGSIKGAQDITMSGQDSHLKNLSDKIKSYEELPEFLTIQNQLKGIADIEDDQKVLSRAIGFLAALLDVGDDEVKASELTIDLSSTTLAFDGQADAKKAPDIDYRVLESFIKRTNLMHFDYGRYVDSSGNEIPSRCIDEYNDKNEMYQENGSIYAIWRRGDTGCDPARDDYAKNEDGSVTVSEINADLEATKIINGTSKISQVNTGEKKEGETEDEPLEDDKKIVNIVPSEKIYRTPQFTDWYKGKAFYTKSDGVEDDRPARQTSEDGKTVFNTVYYKYTPKLNVSDGSVSDIPHFESKCISYTGEESDDKDADGDSTVKWSATNSCLLVPEGIEVTESANGRNQEEQLVLTFSTNLKINPDAFAYKSKHVMAIGPNGQNVTDSYVQLEKLFTAPATECADGDTECNNAKANEGK